MSGQVTPTEAKAGDEDLEGSLTSRTARPGKRCTGRRRRLGRLLAVLAVAASAAACGATGSSKPTVAGHSAAAGGPSAAAAPAAAAAAPAPAAAPAASQSPGSSGQATTAPAVSGSCTLPLTHVTSDGFHIATPPGWELTTLNGRVEVEANTAATEAVEVMPALETGGVTPTSFFNSSLQSLETETRTGGGSFNTTMGKGGDDMPAASFTARVGGNALEGTATVTVLPLETKLASAEVVFVAYWAPASRFGAAQATLSSIASCYGPEKATLFQVFQDQAFTYEAPPGWTVDGENQNGIILNLGSTADVTYLLAEAVPASQSGSAEGLINYYLNSAGIGNVHALWTDDGPSRADSNGAEEQTAYEEFTGTIKGVADHGLVYAFADTGSDGYTSGVVRMALSTESTWNALNSGLIQMAGAIQHDFTQDLDQLQGINQQWQNFGGQVENFDDVLNQQQLVQDPTTGSYYEAPYSSYDTDGADGPGYYSSAGQRLNEVERS